MKTYPTFTEWLKLKGKHNQAAGGPRGGVKHPEKCEKSSGVRCHSDDLNDYEGHMAHNGEVAPYSLKKKSGGKSVAPVAK